MADVCAAVDKPVVMAGSIDSEARVVATATAGAEGFTVGTAALVGAFPADRAGFAAQVRSILAITARASAQASAPRRIALAAHDHRKSHLRAWVHRHARALEGHRLICTGGTGRMIVEAAPSLPVQRLQRGARGGDQQLGALIATGELDAVIFFTDPTQPHGGDADLQALTRLAALHDTPVALSTSAADMIAAALLPPASGPLPR